MNRRPGERIFGVETEFGTLVADETFGPPEGMVEVIKDYLFRDLKLGLLDLHSRDEVFEPAESGGFLLNGGRLYIDAVGSHLEYATAECRSLKDLVANDRAGQRQIVRALKDLGMDDVVSVYNNSIDHFGGHTFGCHENYLIRASEDLFSTQVYLLYPFLVTRQIYAGVGRVGGHILTNGLLRPSYQEVMDHPIDYIWVSNVYGVIPDPSVEFQLSQRADHILKTIASRVRFNRALINPKWEHFYTYEGYTRLHMLFGESNQNEFAYALKVGTTALVIRLLEDDLIPAEVTLSQPLIALREVSRDQDYKWLIKLQEGDRTISAIDLQRIYLDAAQRAYAGEDDQTDWILREWEQILDDLQKDPLALADRVDWVMKRQIVDEYRQSENLEWSDDSLHSVDLEYHNINPETGLFYAMPSRRILDDLDIIDAMTDPPSNTRAFGRSRVIAQLLAKKNPRNYAVDWSGVSPERVAYIDMHDPFETYADAQIPS